MDASDNTTPWVPDEQLVPAILAGAHRDIKTLGDEDRAWLIAGLSAAGMVGDAIAERLGCSVRLIRTIKGSPMGRVCGMYLTEARNFADELRLRDSNLRAVGARASSAEESLARSREKLARLIDAHIVGVECCRRCNTPWDKVNTYWCGTKRYCRECNRRKQVEYRRQLKERMDSTLTVVGYPGSLPVGGSVATELGGPGNPDVAGTGPAPV